MVTRGLLKKEDGTGVWFKKDLGPGIDWYTRERAEYYALKRVADPTDGWPLSDATFTVLIPWEFM